MQARSEGLRRQGKTIVFVPTMGFLHAGHAALLQEGRALGDDLVLSIFVNPTQFGPTEDFEAYPRDMERDLALAAQAGVDAVFTPDRSELYGNDYETYVQLEKLPQHLCGLSRPTHFRGVATVVTKLFHIVKPHIAVFGQKDYQQLAVIRRMVRDLNFDIEIRGLATVREADGLAMSSRNTYLSPAQRQRAVCLYQALTNAAEMVKNGERSAATVMAAARNLISAQAEARIDYISICHPDSLEEMENIAGPALMALAVFFGKTRLIDNMILKPEKGAG